MGERIIGGLAVKPAAREPYASISAVGVCPALKRIARGSMPRIWIRRLGGKQD
jgi:hypothetical protein